MSSIAVEIESENASQHGHVPSTPEVIGIWKWIAATLLMLVMFLLGHATDRITRAEAEKLVQGPSNPYVADRQAQQLELQNIKGQVSLMQSDLGEIKRQLVRLSIAMGVDPDGTDAQLRRRK